MWNDNWFESDDGVARELKYNVHLKVHYKVPMVMDMKCNSSFLIHLSLWSRNRMLKTFGFRFYRHDNITIIIRKCRSIVQLMLISIKILPPTESENTHTQNQHERDTHASFCMQWRRTDAIRIISLKYQELEKKNIFTYWTMNGEMPLVDLNPKEKNIYQNKTRRRKNYLWQTMMKKVNKIVLFSVSVRKWTDFKWNHE